MTAAAKEAAPATGAINMPIGCHFADEHFVTGEYVSLNERGNVPTYHVTSISHL